MADEKEHVNSLAIRSDCGDGPSTAAVSVSTESTDRDTGLTHAGSPASTIPLDCHLGG
jgi:hypothetical protein